MAIEQGSKYCKYCRKQVVAFRKGTNHILHFLFAVITGGLWIPIWILCTIKIGGWKCGTCGR